ncbi:DUF3472 domain-containing protein [Mucilaginibacter sp. BJC16-A38]|uniref:DUF3472 domain-containing protein n=1 Tax=Mucilaginibacter phenanthrenivorans TaxID=1234842 RepID=UPI0021570782|nr:DUF3472 domain-containing protein [Mucilaginibacter phenanthrenivorans]MCR8557038.1 DUF3472 domain-containing protein [Mucilaginibacter phenanthrenivorans]
MQLTKLFFCLLFTTLISLTITSFINANHSNRNVVPDSSITVPLGGNAWRVAKDTVGGTVTNDGIVNWTSKEVKFNVYFRVATKGNFKLWVNLKVADGTSKIAVSALKSTKEIAVSGNEVKEYYVGEWVAKDTGYVEVQVKAISKTGKTFADVSSIKLLGAAINAKTAYVKNNEGSYFYWGRRGPSVHLAYKVPVTNAEWFYNEVTVPVGNDVLGSYFMADGFNVGYFGMQVNSPTERHILFSVWSPFKTDDPKAIPDSQKIIMLKKGPNVHTGEFGAEGSGGQSYMLYNWKAGNTYKFLVRAKPVANNHTEFTTWFFAPELNKWQLIASFSRPQTQTYLKGLHSFLENFDPEQGTITRKVLFTNQWVADENGKWTPINSAHFTNDATAMKGYRMDYAGGVDGNAFYLKNCGFFNNYTVRNTVFERPIAGNAPDVELDKLP